MAADQNRADYGYWVDIATRWADCDPYGHVNNAQYYSFFDTALSTMIIARGVIRSPLGNSIGLCVESQCQFHAPIEFPAMINAGVRIGHLGSKSIRYEIGLFLAGEDKPAATGYFVHVFVDKDSRRPVPLTDGQRAAIADLVVAKG
jgi:acyl-CoA thioester hydrolase